MKDEGKYSSVLVAKYMMAYANDNGIEMNITKLNKLLYILYGTYLAMVGKRLTHEHPHAWPYGPIFLTLREAFINSNGFKDATLSDHELAEIQKDEDLVQCTDDVFRVFGRYNASVLVRWSHNDNAPWSITTNKKGFQWNDIIGDNDIRNYFAKNWQ